MSVDRDEAVGRRDVVAVADEPAEQAVVRRHGRIPSSVTRSVAHAHELSHRCVDEPGRVVVAVAAAGAVDEHYVGAPDLRLPAPAAELVGQRPQPRAALLLHRRSTVSSAAVRVPGRGE